MTLLRALVISVTVAFAAVLTPSHASEAARDSEMRKLYREFLTFKDSAEFRGVGFGAGGPYGVWMQAVVRLNRDGDYLSHLYDRCGLIPDDLRRHARDHMQGKAGQQVRLDAAAWAACFPD